MKIGWHNPTRQWFLQPQSDADQLRLGRLARSGLARRDGIRQGFWVPEIAWADLAAWPWGWKNHRTLFGRYLKTPKVPALFRKPPVVTNLLDYQEEAVAYFLERNGKGFPPKGLFDPMGYGKSVMVLSAWALMRDLRWVDALLVVCPKRVIGEWYAEFRKHMGRPPAEDELLVVNYEAFTSVKRRRAILDFLLNQRAIMVLDEAHLLGNGNSKRTLAVEWFARQEPGRPVAVWPLSGTPVRNRLPSFLPLYRIATGAVVTQQQFETKYPARWKADGSRFYKNADQFTAIFRALFLRRSGRLKLPPKEIFPVRIPLNPRQREQYRQMAEEFLVELQGIDDATFTLKARKNAFSQMTRLLQISSDPALLGDQGADAADERFAALTEILEEAGDEKILVWSRYPGVLDRVVAAYPERNPVALHGRRSDRDNDNGKERFINDPGCTLAGISVDAFGQGLNLQENCHIAVYWDISWRFDKFVQSMARIHRLGQTKGVSIFVFVGEDTLDEYVLDMLMSKFDAQAEVTGVPEEGLGLADLLTRSDLIRLLKKEATA
ncbi:MAG TPA: DEAD/DEAH box helicase [bacterium]|nr:DEAD/DEAH box helicase [bacterium]